MATLVLTTVGSAVGGPIGSAIGAFVGQQIDQAVFSGGSHEGPRLKELSVTTSSYGQSIGRHFGRTRVAGSVIWATDLEENSTSEGGKGRPKTTTYSYSASFAVALSSTPIDRLGRVWADGNLLRGVAGDLKTGGELRTYLGNGNTFVDPLIAADRGSEAPAFRDCAYVVFEDLQLADFGNRIPALTFEVFADPDSQVSLKQLVPTSNGEFVESPLPHIRGFVDEGGDLANTLSLIDRVYPLNCTTTPSGLSFRPIASPPRPVVTLPPSLALETDGNQRERHISRNQLQSPPALALRYYDENRDYQPGVQRAIGRRANGIEAVVDLPATMTAAGAQELANANNNRLLGRSEKATWRVSELDPDIAPGRIVRLPGVSGLWRVMSWEWFDRGVELILERSMASTAAPLSGDPGLSVPPADLQAGPTVLDVFELPAENGTNPSKSSIFAAASSDNEAWRGAALYAEQGVTLLPIGSTGSSRSTIGELLAPLASSASLVLETEATIQVHSFAEDMLFAATDPVGLSNGANRLLVGGEVLQYLTAQSLGSGAWSLRGLLRGRAGTEDAAASGHPELTPVVALDASIVELDHPTVQSSPLMRIAAIGQADDDAVFAELRNSGLSRRPPTPVHPRVRLLQDQSIEICWTRRARGHWLWDYADEIPLVEEVERYLVGFGPVEAPFAAFTTYEPRFSLSQSEREGLVQLHGTANLWVAQIGTYVRSNALFLSQL